MEPRGKRRWGTREPSAAAPTYGFQERRRRTDGSGTVVGQDAYTQTVQILKNIGVALAKAGAKLDDVVRTRIFVTDIKDWQEVGRAHGEVFSSVRPATTMVQVSTLIAPDMLVEIEADAFIQGDI